MVDSTGIPTLDSMLDGGYPEQKVILATGGPGTGKSTLAMQFLQQGLEEGERGLFISTEQTIDDLYDSFSPFDFDLAADDLTIATIRADTEYSAPLGAEMVFLRTRVGRDRTPDRSEKPFSSNFLAEFIRDQGDIDRLVIDSVTGLEPMTSDPRHFRQELLELVLLFSEQLESTAIFTAERPLERVFETPGSAHHLQYTAHGVVRLESERIEGDVHRRLEVKKMRGAAYDTRIHSVEFTNEGLRVLPRIRPEMRSVPEISYLSTGVDGLNELCGGGLPLGGTNVVQHDGLGGIRSLTASIVVEALRDDMAVAFIPGIESSVSDVLARFPSDVPHTDELFKHERFFVIDMLTDRPPNDEEDNRYYYQTTEKSFQEIVADIDRQRGDRDLLLLSNPEAVLSELDAEDIRQVWYWIATNIIGEADVGVQFLNQKATSKDLTEMYVGAAQQVVRTWVDEYGLQHLKLRKSPEGLRGSVRLVEAEETPPYVRVQRHGRRPDEHHPR